MLMCRKGETVSNDSGTKLIELVCSGQETVQMHKTMHTCIFNIQAKWDSLRTKGG